MKETYSRDMFHFTADYAWLIAQQTEQTGHEKLNSPGGKLIIRTLD